MNLQLFFSRFLLCAILVFCFFYRSNGQLLIPKVPKTAIVSAGSSQKVCDGVNTVDLQAVIPDWISGRWEGGNTSDYSDILNPSTTYTNTVNLETSNYPYAVANHDFYMKIGSITNSPQFKETVTSVFFPPNNNPSLIVTPTCSTCPNFRLSLLNSEHRTRADWVAIDGPYVAYNGGIYSVCDGTYQIKVGVFGCQMNYAFGTFTPTNAGTGCPPNLGKGFIEIEIEPIELAANRYVSSSITDGIGGFWAMNLEDGSSTFNTGTYTISTGFPNNNFDPNSITEVAPTTVTVGTNTNQLITRRYEYRKGRLTVALTSSSCSSNNQNFIAGSWSIDGISFYPSFTTIDVLNGTHTLYFADVEGYVSPQTATITIEGNKRTVVLAEYQKRPPCGRNDFGQTGEIEEGMIASEDAACNPEGFSRDDYHSYDLENILCPTTLCSRDQIWDLFKSKISNQVPLADDFTPVTTSGNFSQGIRTAFAKALFPDPNWNPNSQIEQGDTINLFSPESYAILTGAYCALGGAEACVTWIALGRTLAPGPIIYSNPVALYIDEQNKCITNYTLPNHILYPGRVTRCIIEECDLIKVKTFGNGLHKWGDNWGGARMAWINRFYGKYVLFENVDNRFKNLVDQNFPPGIQQNTSAQVISNPIGIENKVWIIKGRSCDLSTSQVRRPSY